MQKVQFLRLQKWQPGLLEGMGKEGGGQDTRSRTGYKIKCGQSLLLDWRMLKVPGEGTGKKYLKIKPPLVKKKRKKNQKDKTKERSSA